MIQGAIQGAIQGGWAFVLAAYALTFAALTVLVLATAWRARRWAREAEKLDKP